MGLGPAKQSGGGTAGGGAGGAANSFQVTIKTDIGKVSAKEFRKEAVQQAKKSKKKLSAAVLPTAIPGGVADSNASAGGMVAAAKANVGPRKTKLLFAGAEGFRVGDVRLSRTGFSLSEKTLVGAGKLGVVAAAGQVIGSGLTLAVQTRDDIRKGKSAGEIATNLLVKGPGKVAVQISELFGADKMAAAMISLITGDDIDFVKSAAMRGRKKIFDYKGWQKDREDEAATALSQNAKAQIEIRQAIRAHRIKEYPQDTLSLTDYIRDDIANSQAEERLFARDLDGRPLYKTLRVSMNSGQ